MIPRAYGRGCSRPKREGAIRQGSKVTGMQLLTRLASYAISDEQGQEKSFWTTGKEPGKQGRYGY
jgi:hypothetical protein